MTVKHKLTIRKLEKWICEEVYKGADRDMLVAFFRKVNGYLGIHYIAIDVVEQVPDELTFYLSQPVKMVRMHFRRQKKEFPYELESQSEQVMVLTDNFTFTFDWEGIIMVKSQQRDGLLMCLYKDIENADWQRQAIFGWQIQDIRNCRLMPMSEEEKSQLNTIHFLDQITTGDDDA